MRQNKIPTIMFPKKYEEPKLYFHCSMHPERRIIRLPDGLRCPECGCTNVATKTVMTYENKEKET